MTVFSNFHKICLAVLFVWISFIPLPLQGRYPLQLKIFFLTGSFLLCIKHGRPIVKNSDWPFWLFLAAISLSVYGSASSSLAVATYLDLSIPIVYIYYLLAENFSSRENFTFLSRWICICSIVVAFWGLMDVILRVNFLYEALFPNPFYDTYKLQWPMRAIATQFHAPPLGTYLIASLPFSLLTMEQDRSLYKMLGIVGVVITVIVTPLTFSRGVFLSLFCMLSFIFFCSKKTKWLPIFLLGLVVFMMVSGHLPYPFSKFGKNVFLFGSDGIFSPYRFERIQMLGKILKDHPFTGIGFQHVRLLFFHYYPGGVNIDYNHRIMDNMYLTLAAETGLIGLASFLLLLGSMVAKGWQSLRRFHDHPIEKRRVLYLWIGFSGLLINAAAYELFYWPSQYMFFCIYVGLIEAFHRQTFASMRSGVGKMQNGNSAF